MPKKSFIDPELLQNTDQYKKFSLMSKLIEKPVCDQLQEYLFDNNLYAMCLSANRVGNSTEIAILCVHNDVMYSLEKRHGAILIMPDLSAAVEAIDHDIFLHRLHPKFGVNGTALKWLSSYLYCRT